MKKFLLLTSLVFSAVSTASSFAQEADDSPQPLVSFVEKASVKIGMSPEQVVAQLGAPSEKMADNVWAYWDFRPLGRPAGERYNALVVIFMNDQVRLLRLTERSHVEAAIAKLRANAAKSPVIARK